MNIGERKKITNSYIDEFSKKCSIKNIACSNCLLFDNKLKWCSMFKDDLFDELKNGKNIKE